MEPFEKEIKPVETGLKPEETVEGRLPGLLNPGNPLMKAAETYGLQSANKRGLLNSSIAVGTAQGEMVKTALPIAQQDAAAMQNQKQSILQGDIQGNLYGTQAGYSSQLSKQESDQSMEKLNVENDIKMQLANLDISNREKTAMAEGVAELGKILSDQVANIQRDPNVSSGSKTSAIQSLQAAHKANLDSLASIYGVEIAWGSSSPAAPPSPSATTSGEPNLNPGYVAPPSPPPPSQPPPSGQLAGMKDGQIVFTDGNGGYWYMGSVESGGGEWTSSAPGRVSLLKGQFDPL